MVPFATYIWSGNLSLLTALTIEPHFEQNDFEYEGLKFPGVVMDITGAKSSEHNLRNFYRRWAEFSIRGRFGIVNMVFYLQ